MDENSSPLGDNSLFLDQNMGGGGPYFDLKYWTPNFIGGPIKKLNTKIKNEYKNKIKEIYNLTLCRQFWYCIRHLHLTYMRIKLKWSLLGF